MTPLTKERYEELVKTAPTRLDPLLQRKGRRRLQGPCPSHLRRRQRRLPYTIARRQGRARLGRPFDAVNGHPRGAAPTPRAPMGTGEEDRHPAFSRGLEDDLHDRPVPRDNGVAQMADKGRIQEGKDADITIFDPRP